MDETIVWKDRKRIFFGLPWTFTRYALTEEKLYIKTGVFSTREEEVRLYRIMDVTLKRSLWERLCGLGTIHCCSADKSSPEFDLLHIKRSQQIKNMLSDMVEAQRDKKRIVGREFMGGDEDMDALDDMADTRVDCHFAWRILHFCILYNRMCNKSR